VKHFLVACDKLHGLIQNDVELNNLITARDLFLQFALESPVDWNGALIGHVLTYCCNKAIIDVENKNELHQLAELIDNTAKSFSNWHFVSGYLCDLVNLRPNPLAVLTRCIESLTVCTSPGYTVQRELIHVNCIGFSQLNLIKGLWFKSVRNAFEGYTVDVFHDAELAIKYLSNMDLNLEEIAKNTGYNLIETIYEVLQILGIRVFVSETISVDFLSTDDLLPALVRRANQVVVMLCGSCGSLKFTCEEEKEASLGVKITLEEDETLFPIRLVSILFIFLKVDAFKFSSTTHWPFFVDLDLHELYYD